MVKFVAVLISVVILGGCASVAPGLYFPSLAERAHRQDPDALQRILDLADTTPPGEQLEELAELSSKYVKQSPAIFLANQRGRTGCFGASFMGPEFVDREDLREAERAARYAALESVRDQALAEIKERCLADLHESQQFIQAERTLCVGLNQASDAGTTHHAQ